MKKLLLAAFLCLLTATSAFAGHDDECGPDGLTKTFHAQYDNAKNSYDRIDAINAEYLRQKKWLDDYTSSALKRMNKEKAKALQKAQNAWKKWMTLESKFLDSIASGSRFAEEDEYAKLIALVDRVVFIRSHTVGEESYIDYAVPKVNSVSPTRDNLRRTSNGQTMRYDAKMKEWVGDASSLSDILSEERGVQDKWLNEDYKALRKLLNSTQNLALRDTQRAWLSFRDIDADFIYSPEDGTLSRDAANFDQLNKLVEHTARLEHLLDRTRANMP